MSGRTISLTRGLEALIDDEDFEILNKWKWSALKAGHGWYATRGTHRGGKNGYFYMHREILGALAHGKQIDHINGDGLDNRRANLRLASAAENQRNKRKQCGCKVPFKGVWEHLPGIYRTAIYLNGTKRLYLGCFASSKDAARAYDRAAEKYFGEFAKLNFPKEVQ